MAWDDSKSTFDTASEVPADQKITSAEWNTHVTDQKSHASRHEDGGSDEIDAADLAAALGTAGQVLQSDGAAATWATLVASDIGDFDEAAQDAVGAITSGGDKITVTYDDANDALTIDTSALDTEEVEDAVNTLLTAGSGITLTYDDVNDTLTVAVDEASVDHDALLNFVANEHVDHSGVNINAGTLLTGGGDITASRTLNVDEGSISHDGIDQTTVSANDHHQQSVGETVTASGDGTTTVFTLAHSLGTTPAAAHVQAASEDASTDFWVSNKTSTDVEITYAAAPASGTDNLAFEVITHA